MKLQTKCKHCREYLFIKYRAADRFELAKKIGKNPELQCNYCNETHKYNLNEIKAVPNKILLLIASAIFLIGTGLTIYFLWDYFFKTSDIYSIAVLAGMIGFPYLIYEAINSIHRQKINYFNSKTFG